MTCATLVAYRMGIQRAIITPQGLRKVLIEMGARRVTMDD